MCEQLLQQFMGRWCSGHKRIDISLSAEEKDIIRLAVGSHSFITPKKVCGLLGVEQQKARKLLHGLMEKNILHPGKESDRRISRYTLSSSISLDDLML